MDFDLTSLIPYWSILAGFLAAFMFIDRSGDKQKDFVHRVANEIFEVEKILTNPIYLKSIGKNGKAIGNLLFELRSFPLSCLYAFSFCFLCIILAIFSSNINQPVMKHIMIILIIYYSIVMGYVALHGEVWVKRKTFYSYNTLTNAAFFSLIRRKNVQTERGDSIGRLVEYYSMLSVRPAVSYLQAILIIVIIFAISIFYYVNHMFGNAVCNEIDGIVMDICIVLSLIIPFSPFVCYTLMIRHRRNIVKEFLVYKTDAKGIEFGDRAPCVLPLKGFIYTIESVISLYIAQCLTLNGTVFPISHMLYYFVVIFAVHTLYLYISHRNKVNTIGPEREIDEWTDMNDASNVFWTAIRDSVCVCVLIPFDIRLNEFWLGIIIFFGILLILRVIINNILFNLLIGHEPIKSVMKWLGVIPRPFSYQKGSGFVFEKDEKRFEAVFLWDKFYAKDMLLLSFKDMEKEGYELKRSHKYQEITGYYFVKDDRTEQAIQFGKNFYALVDSYYSHKEMTEKGYKFIFY